MTRFHALALYALLAIVAAIFMRPAIAADDNPVLTAGDIIQIVLPGEPDFDAPFQLDSRGVIQLPEAGALPVSGIDVDTARRRIYLALSSAYRDLSQLEVRLKERRLVISVLGFVKEPKEVDLPEYGNVQMAVSAAGGLRQGAQLDRFQLRRGEDTRVFDYKAYLDSGDLNAIPALQSGDTIFVPSSPLIGNVEVEFDAKTLTAAGDAGEERGAVKVFGEVQNPGTFAFKSDQTVVDVIMRAGGLTRYAGVEKIRIMNGGAPVVFDLKKYFDTGDATLLPKLQEGATVYVPINVDEVKAGVRTVYVMGEVAKPGSYEMTEGANFFDVLANAGGPNRYAETRQLRVIRANGEVLPFDLAGYTEGRPGLTVPAIHPGDAIFVPEKTDQLEKSWLKIGTDRAIRIIGQVHRPGRYEWSDEMSLLDLMAHAGGPTQYGDATRIKILHQNGDRAEARVFDLQSFINEGGSLADLPRLNAGDTVTVPELPRDPSDNRSQWTRLDSDRAIYVMGAVGAPGRYAFNPSLHFLDIVSAANGPTPNADLQNIRISHRDGSGSRVSKVNLALYFETGDDSLLPQVVPGDVIYVPGRDRDYTETDPAAMVRVLGSVRNPGRYKFDDSMTILDLLAEAGGPAADAWQEKIVVVHVVDGEPKATAFDLVQFARGGDFSELPVVRKGDTVYVPSLSQSDWQIFMNGVRDVFQVVSIFAVLGAL
ncbi:MAG: SLBB domain-containing protein [Minwuia sp.]|uniref:SLBB domain-containing protein n=1 Tax=Minwuia sp. TaxID=2493630 RepID=UPI003A8B8E7C